MNACLLNDGVAESCCRVATAFFRLNSICCVQERRKQDFQAGSLIRCHRPRSSRRIQTWSTTAAVLATPARSPEQDDITELSDFRQYPEANAADCSIFCSRLSTRPVPRGALARCPARQRESAEMKPKGARSPCSVANAPPAWQTRMTELLREVPPGKKHRSYLSPPTKHRSYLSPHPTAIVCRIKRHAEAVAIRRRQL